MNVLARLDKLVVFRGIVKFLEAYFLGWISALSRSLYFFGS